MPPTVAHADAAADTTANVRETVGRAREAQRQWANRSIATRLAVLKKFRHALAADPLPWAEEIDTGRRRTTADSLAAEVMPLADACRFLERNAAKILRDKKPSAADRPIWGRGLRVRIRREPCGVVLVIGPGNYPLFLPGVQVLQAIAAGNAAVVKPAPGCSAPVERLAAGLRSAGLPPGVVQLLDESPAAAEQAIAAGADHVVLTGGVETGRAVLRQTAETVTPCTMELSGSDPMIVLPGADIDRVAAAIELGLKMNGGATCIGPRRVFVTPRDAMGLVSLLEERLAGIPPTVLPRRVADQAKELFVEAIDQGATPLFGEPRFDPAAFDPIVLRVPNADSRLATADLFAPVLSIVEVDSPAEAARHAPASGYALGASVFGEPAAAEQLAETINAGCVTVNDLIVPTADPRVAFGGRGQSGFGITRGAEGLLELTRVKTIVTQRARWLPHLDPPRPGLACLLTGLMQLSHGKTLADRWKGLRSVIANSRNKVSTTKDTKD